MPPCATGGTAMTMQYFSVPAGDAMNRAAPGGDGAANRKPLAPRSPERVRRLRKHLVASLRAMRTMKDPVASASPLRPEPEGFVGRVANAACTACRGWCCKGGGDHAYLDERVMARVRHAQPNWMRAPCMRLYVERVPAVGYDGSCVFHGAARLHAGPFAAIGCVQQLFLHRAWQLRERRRCRDPPSWSSPVRARTCAGRPCCTAIGDQPRHDRRRSLIADQSSGLIRHQRRVGIAAHLVPDADGVRRFAHGDGADDDADRRDGDRIQQADQRDAGNRVASEVAMNGTPPPNTPLPT